MLLLKKKKKKKIPETLLEIWPFLVCFVFLCSASSSLLIIQGICSMVKAGQKNQIAETPWLLEGSQGFSESLRLDSPAGYMQGGRTGQFGLQTMSSLLPSHSPNTRCFIWIRNDIWLENTSPFSFAALSGLWFIYLFIYPWLKLAINYGLDGACSF